MFALVLRGICLLNGEKVNGYSRPLFYFHPFNTVDKRSILFLLMAGFELRTLGIGVTALPTEPQQLALKGDSFNTLEARIPPQNAPFPGRFAKFNKDPKGIK